MIDDNVQPRIDVDPGTEGFVGWAKVKLRELTALRLDLGLEFLQRAWIVNDITVRILSTAFGDHIKLEGGGYRALHYEAAQTFAADATPRYFLYRPKQKFVPRPSQAPSLVFVGTPVGNPLALPPGDLPDTYTGVSPSASVLQSQMALTAGVHDYGWESDAPVASVQVAQLDALLQSGSVNVVFQDFEALTRPATVANGARVLVVVSTPDIRSYLDPARYPTLVDLVPPTALANVSPTMSIGNLPYAALDQQYSWKLREYDMRTGVLSDVGGAYLHRKRMHAVVSGPIRVVDTLGVESSVEGRFLAPTVREEFEALLWAYPKVAFLLVNRSEWTGIVKTGEVFTPAFGLAGVYRWTVSAATVTRRVILRNMSTGTEEVLAEVALQSTYGGADSSTPILPPQSFGVDVWGEGGAHSLRTAMFSISFYDGVSWAGMFWRGHGAPNGGASEALYVAASDGLRQQLELPPNAMVNLQPATAQISVLSAQDWVMYAPHLGGVVLVWRHNGVVSASTTITAIGVCAGEDSGSIVPGVTRIAGVRYDHGALAPFASVQAFPDSIPSNRGVWVLVQASETQRIYTSGPTSGSPLASAGKGSPILEVEMLDDVAIRWRHLTLLESVHPGSRKLVPAESGEIGAVAITKLFAPLLAEDLPNHAEAWGRSEAIGSRFQVGAWHTLTPLA